MTDQPCHRLIKYPVISMSHMFSKKMYKVCVIHIYMCTIFWWLDTVGSCGGCGYTLTLDDRYYHLFKSVNFGSSVLWNYIYNRVKPASAKATQSQARISLPTSIPWSISFDLYWWIWPTLPRLWLWYVNQWSGATTGYIRTYVMAKVAVLTEHVWFLLINH